MRVYSECCKNCLLSPDSIVSPSRRKEILQKCATEQSHFICHKASMHDQDVCCKTFYDTMGYRSQLIRIMQRLNAIEFVPQPEHDKLPTYSEMKGR